jgi:hypothetical protein
MTEALYKLEEQAEAKYRAAVAAHWIAWKNGVEIGDAEVNAAKAFLLSIRDRMYRNAEWMAAAERDAAERSHLMLDDA